MAPRLPTECLAHVIGYLAYGEHGQICPTRLYKLLTVNKTFFLLCAEYLYRDPISAVLSCPNRLWSLKNLAMLIMTHTRCKDRVLSFHFLDLVLSSSSFPALPPMADYLSFIRAMKFNKIASDLLYEGNHRSQPVNAAHSEITLQMNMMTLLEAVCGGDHGYSKLRSVSIPAKYLSDQLACQLVNVELVSVLFYQEGQSNWRPTVVRQLDETISFTKRLLLSRSLSRISLGSGCDYQADEYDLSGTRNWRLNIHLCEFGHNPRNIRWQDFQPQLKDLYSLLPIVLADSSILCMDEEDADRERFLAMPESVDLSSVTTIQQLSNGSVEDYRRIFPREKKSATLQRCRGLKEVALALGREEDSHKDELQIFDWAAKEKREANVTAIDRNNSNNNNHGPPLVALETLELEIGSRHIIALNKTLSDAVFAFGSSLRTIIIGGTVGVTVDLVYFRDLPELRELDLWEMEAIESSGVPFEGCPRLETVRLCDRFRGPHHALSSLSFPPSHSPTLKALSLHGNVGRRFSQESFKSMVDVRILSVDVNRDSEEIEESHMEITTTAADPIGYGGYVCDLACWLNLTSLESLYLYGEAALTFRFSVLAHYPNIDHVSLTSPHHAPDRDSFYAFEDVLDDVELFKEKPFGTITSIYFEKWQMTEDLLKNVLPIIFPNLESFNVRCSGVIIDQELCDTVRGKFSHLDAFFLIDPIQEEGFDVVDPEEET